MKWTKPRTLEPVTRGDMIRLIEINIRQLEKEIGRYMPLEELEPLELPSLERVLQVYVAISLKLRMEENPNV